MHNGLIGHTGQRKGVTGMDKQAIEAEGRKVVRGFQRYDSAARAECAASFRLGHRQRQSTGEFFYTHPAVPGVCFPTRAAAARAALAKARGDA